MTCLQSPLRTLQLFEPDPRATYTIEAAAQIAQVPPRLIGSSGNCVGF